MDFFAENLRLLVQHGSVEHGKYAGEAFADCGFRVGEKWNTGGIESEDVLTVHSPNEDGAFVVRGLGDDDAVWSAKDLAGTQYGIERPQAGVVADDAVEWDAEGSEIRAHGIGFIIVGVYSVSADDEVLHFSGVKQGGGGFDAIFVMEVFPPGGDKFGGAQDECGLAFGNGIDVVVETSPGSEGDGGFREEPCRKAGGNAEYGGVKSKLESAAH